MSELLRVYAPEECGEDGYPYAWDRSIKSFVREQAGNRCLRCKHPYEKGDGEWSPCDEHCDHDGPWRIDGFIYETDDPLLTRRPQWPYTTPHRVYARWRVLTTHHLNGDKADCRWWNLVPLCQRCHLLIQRKVVMDQLYPFEHSSWFQPYAAAHYALKYENREITRQEADTRKEELLAYERIA